MPTKTITITVLLGSLLFISVGEFFPQPIKSASLKTRNTVNEFVLGLFPSWKPKTDPYKRTEEAIQQEKDKAR